MNRFEKISLEQWNKDMSSMRGYKVDSFHEWDKIKLPQRATTKSAGYDIFAPYDITIPPRCTVKVPTGIRVILDDDKFLAIYPRSGLGFKYKMQLYNSVGIIDADYAQSNNEGHIWCKFYNDSPDGKTIVIKKGGAMCQGIIQQFFMADDDNAIGIRNGGFGSTT